MKKFRRVALDKKYRSNLLRGAVAVIVVMFALLYAANQRLIQDYKNLESAATEDRYGTVLTLRPNAKQEYGQYSDTVPSRVKQLLVQKEDRFFYFHLGINPISIARAAARYMSGRRPGGASTITQQLAKNLLGTEQDRSLANKFLEMLASFDLELFNTKENILTMYANTVYMGNRVQGLDTASRVYFNQNLESLDDTQLIMLLATLSSPTVQNPWGDDNRSAAKALARRLRVAYVTGDATTTRSQSTYAPPANFELASMRQTCSQTCKTTLDADLTDRVRNILEQHVLQGWDAGVRSGAIVVIKLPEDELLSVVGTPDTNSVEPGQQINMAIQPRPIGSTAKPFIYLEGFARGLRPYTLVNDREYKFPIGTGFSLYPKNYDGTYHGWVTLHTALSNSFNVPTVKVLQYIGLPDFYDFLQNKLGFTPLQDIDSYQYGIALGALEMDPLTLAHYLTIFPEEGTLKPLRLYVEGTTTQSIATPMSAITGEVKIADPAFTELVSRVLNDRFAGVQQFGLASSLNLSQSNYAVKTGTSQNYHDTWTVGYTPDFLVAVWLGNPQNSALKQVTGQSGAGAIWHDVMELLMNSQYNKQTPLSFGKTSEFVFNGSVDFGLPDDVVAEHRNLLPDNELITSPQQGDTFLEETRTAIPLVSQESVSWYANGVFLGEGTRVVFSPLHADDYIIKAVDTAGNTANILIHVTARR